MRGWLLDTNVVAELARPTAARRVVAWAESQVEARVFISVLTLGEYDKGIAQRPAAAPGRARLEAAVAALAARFAGRILPVGDAVVRRCGRIEGAILFAGVGGPHQIEQLPSLSASAAGKPAARLRIGIGFTFTKSGLLGLLDEHESHVTAGVQDPGVVSYAVLEIEGPEAVTIARKLAEFDEVTVQQGESKSAFPLDGAKTALEKVFMACPSMPR